MNWTIIGCGWLGTNLGKALVENGNAVIGTTTTIDKRDLLTQKGIKHIVFNIKSQISVELYDFTEIVVLSIPPFDRDNYLTYGEDLLHLVKQFKPVTRFFFLSSTSIYPQKNGIFNEDYYFDDSEKLTSLYQAEKQLFDFLKNRLTILRLGGLFGNNRHPIYSLEGKINVKNPEGKINLVGQKDIISIMQLITEQESFGEVFNIVYPNHPTRKKYYTQAAKALNLKIPTFNNSTSIIRVIPSDKVQKKLAFIFEETI